MDAIGANTIGQVGNIDLNQARFDPSNVNSPSQSGGVSQDFVDAATALGQEQIQSGEAPAGANPYDLVLQGIAANLTTVVDILSFDFDTTAD